MSELRLYCDLLVQQVQTIQTQYTADTDATPTVEVARLLFRLNNVTFGSFRAATPVLLSSAGFSAQCHLYNFYQDFGGMHDPRQPESDPWPPTYWKGNYTSFCCHVLRFNCSEINHWSTTMWSNNSVLKMSLACYCLLRWKGQSVIRELTVLTGKFLKGT